jgi:multidrug resistance efflux pump
VGQEVVEGQLMARVKSQALDGARDLALQELQRAEERATASETKVTSARLEASRAQAVAMSARALADKAERAYQRQALLYREGATARLAYERAQEENARAQADRQTAEKVAEHAAAQASAATAEASEDRKAAQMRSEAADTAKEHAAAGEVVAPVAGTVVGRHGEPGGAVNPSVTNLFEIGVDAALLEVHLEAPAEVLRRVSVGERAIVQVVELGLEPMAGSVKEVTPAGIVVAFLSPSPLVKPGLTAQVTLGR